MSKNEGLIYRISGPVVTATGIEARMYEVVRVGHDDFLFLLPPLHTEDVLHPGLFADAINVAEREQIAGPGILSAGDGAGRAGREADRPDGAALAVRDEQFARANGESGRLRPGGLKWIGVVEVLLGAVAAEVVGDFLFKIVRPNLVCAGHGDEHLAALDVHVPRGADDLFASASSAARTTSYARASSNGSVQSSPTPAAPKSPRRTLGAVTRASSRSNSSILCSYIIFIVDTSSPC